MIEHHSKNRVIRVLHSSLVWKHNPLTLSVLSAHPSAQHQKSESTFAPSLSLSGSSVLHFLCPPSHKLGVCSDGSNPPPLRSKLEMHCQSHDIRTLSSLKLTLVHGLWGGTLADKSALRLSATCKRLRHAKDGLLAPFKWKLTIYKDQTCGLLFTSPPSLTAFLRRAEINCMVTITTTQSIIQSLARLEDACDSTHLTSRASWKVMRLTAKWLRIQKRCPWLCLPAVRLGPASHPRCKLRRSARCIACSCGREETCLYLRSDAIPSELEVWTVAVAESIEDRSASVSCSTSVSTSLLKRCTRSDAYLVAVATVGRS